MRNKRLKPRELTPEEQEERDIEEEVFLETSGFSSREEYDRHQQELIRNIQACEHDIWLDEQRREREEKFRKGEPCDHPGCKSHVTHPCEGCGRQW